MVTGAGCLVAISIKNDGFSIKTDEFVSTNVLGDDPPCGDITGLLRVEGFTMRHLNERQMPTNIAMIVCDKILTDGCVLRIAI